MIFITSHKNHPKHDWFYELIVVVERVGKSEQDTSMTYRMCVPLAGSSPPSSPAAPPSEGLPPTRPTTPKPRSRRRVSSSCWTVCLRSVSTAKRETNGYGGGAVWYARRRVPRYMGRAWKMTYPVRESSGKVWFIIPLLPTSLILHKSCKMPQKTDRRVRECLSTTLGVMKNDFRFVRIR